MKVTQENNNLSFKTKALNRIREIFKIPYLERRLAKLTKGKSPNYVFSKLVPNCYQYIQPSFRTIDLDELKFRLDISDYIGHYIYFGFSDKSQEKLFALCKSDFNVIDVGTNIGFVALKLSRLASNGQVVGFEPDPYNFERAVENIKLNKFDNIVIHNLGLGDKKSKALMEVRTSTNRGGNRIAPLQQYGVEVIIETLDNFFSTLKMDKVHLIKIDVEGYELKVLRGSFNIISIYKPILFIEVNDNNLRDQGDSAKSLILYLSSLGYTSFVDAETDKLITPNSDFTNCHIDIIAQ